MTKRFIKLKCKKCGELTTYVDHSFLITKSFKCPKCKTKLNPVDLKSLKNALSILQDSPDFEVILLDQQQFNKLELSVKAQDQAYKFVADECKSLNIEVPKYEQLFGSQNILHSFMLGLVMGGIDEYHQQLRAVLKERGIILNDFVENPLYPSR